PADQDPNVLSGSRPHRIRATGHGSAADSGQILIRRMLGRYVRPRMLKTSWRSVVSSVDRPDWTALEARIGRGPVLRVHRWLRGQAGYSRPASTKESAASASSGDMKTL